MPYRAAAADRPESVRVGHARLRLRLHVGRALDAADRSARWRWPDLQGLEVVAIESDRHVAAHALQQVFLRIWIGWEKVQDTPGTSCAQLLLECGHEGLLRRPSSIRFWV